MSSQQLLEHPQLGQDIDYAHDHDMIESKTS